MYCLGMANNIGADQTVQMCRLISVFLVRIYVCIYIYDTERFSHEMGLLYQ